MLVENREGSFPVIAAFVVFDANDADTDKSVKNLCLDCNSRRLL